MKIESIILIDHLTFLLWGCWVTAVSKKSSSTNDLYSSFNSLFINIKFAKSSQLDKYQLKLYGYGKYFLMMNIKRNYD
mgnify:CR=1 FL=1